MKTSSKFLTLALSILLICAIIPAQIFAQDNAPATTGDKLNEPVGTSIVDPADAAGSLVEPASLGENETTISGKFILVGSTLDPLPTDNPYEVWLEIPFTVAAGTNAKDLTDTVLADNNYTVTYASSSFGDYLNKITPPADKTAQHELEGGVTNGTGSAWMWTYNDNFADTGADGYEVKDGDEIRWYFINDWSQNYNGHPEQFTAEDEVSPTLVDPEAYAASPSGLTSWWPAFGGAMKHNSTKDLTVKLAGFEAKEVFTIQKSGSWTDYFSDPIQVGEWIYVVFSDTLYKLNRDGTVNKEAKMEAAIDTTSRIAFADGLIVVPVQKGKVQAFTADTLKTVWIAGAPETEDDMQSLTSLKIVDGIVYQGLCTVGWTPRSFGGVFRAINLNDGSTKWEFSSDKTGFYWSGAALINRVLVIGNDLGEIFAFNPETGAIIDKMTLPVHSDGQAPAIRTNMIASGNQLFFVSQQDGMLNRLNINSDGSFGVLKRVKFSDSSTASPTVVAGKVYVAGLNTFAIIDAAKMTIDKSYDIEGNIQATPLVVKDKAGQIFVYFTINMEPGAIYGLTPDEDKIHTVYTPDEGQQNWCMASLSISANGTLYYSNDSQTFFAVKLTEIDDVPSTDGDSGKSEQGKVPATGEDFTPQYMLAISLLAASAMLFILRNKLRKTKSGNY
ncbi:MAG: PQQ-binding-like beta-propeller repeat protein [Clostridiaceae bacterium]|nr:PQQ-binding-like beta-propeller repeat protein [Clostridiaceae bacterium]